MFGNWHKLRGEYTFESSLSAAALPVVPHNSTTPRLQLLFAQAGFKPNCEPLNLRRDRPMDTALRAPTGHHPGVDLQSRFLLADVTTTDTDVGGKIALNTKKSL